MGGMGAGIILCMRSAYERRRYNVTSSLIGCAHAQNEWRIVVGASSTKLSDAFSGNKRLIF